MIPKMPTIGVRFDIGKMTAGSHAEDAWGAFWRVVDPAALPGSLLFDGDLADNVFCIAVQSMDGGALATVEQAVASSDECSTLCCDPMFAKGEDVTKETLSIAGNVDSGGNLIGEASRARSALAGARPERAAAGPAPPGGARPASELTRGFTTRASTIGSHAARAALSGGSTSAAAAKPVAPRKRSSAGRTILLVLVAIVVLGLIALMIFGPEPGGAPPEGSRAPRARTPAAKVAPAKVAPAEGTEKAGPGPVGGDEAGLSPGGEPEGGASD